MAINQDVATTVLREVAQNKFSAIANKVPLLDSLRSQGGIETISGGKQIDVPIELVEHSNITEHLTGNESSSLGYSDIYQTATFDWCDLSSPIIMNRKDSEEASGDKARVDILAARTENVVQKLMRNVEEFFLAGSDGSGQAFTNLETLNGESSSSANSGWLEAVAFGSQVNTVGGIAKSSHTVGWQHAYATASDDFATNGLDAMDDIYTKITVESMAGEPDLVLASVASFKLYRSDLTTQERYMSGDSLDGRRASLAYAGAMMHPSKYLGFTSTGGEDMSMYFLSTEALKLYFAEGADFDIGDFIQAYDAPVRVAQVYVKLQLVLKEMNALGVLVDAES